MTYPVMVAIVSVVSLAAIGARTGAPPQGNLLVYADFEKMENNRPVSSRGGLIQLYAYEESHVHKSTFKGLAGADPPAPELVRIRKDDPNLAMKFDYSLTAPRSRSRPGSPSGAWTRRIS